MCRSPDPFHRSDSENYHVPLSRPFSTVFTCHIEHAPLEPVDSSFPHAAIHNLVELLHPSQSPSRQVAPEPLWVLQTLGVQGGMILGHGGQLQRIGYAGGKPRGERFVEDAL